MEESLNKNSEARAFYYIIIFILAVMFVVQSIAGFAQEKQEAAEIPFDGVPKVTINMTDLDETGALIYCGIDIAVFWDPDKDGKFTVVPNDTKIKRLITTNTNITFDLGPTSSFKKGIQHKLAMRTLYVPTGTKQEPIVIAGMDNGNDGWVEIPGTVFIPTYFINPPGNPYVHHTDKWDENRTTFNTAKTKARKTEAVRSDGVFWSGEKFMLNVETAEIVSAVSITIIDEKDDKKQAYEKTITTFQEHETISGAAIYTGELWDKSMFNKWGNYVPKTLTFKIGVLDEKDEVLEEKLVNVVVDNRDLFYRSRRQY